MRARRDDTRISRRAGVRLAVAALIALGGATITSAGGASGAAPDEVDHPCATRPGEIALCR